MSRAVHVANWASNGIRPACGARAAMPTVTLNPEAVTCNRCQHPDFGYFLKLYSGPAVELSLEALVQLVDIKRAPGYVS